MARIFHEFGRALRESGQALDRLGLYCMDLENTFRVPLSRHRQLMALADKRPAVAPEAWVAPSASAIGNVTIAKGASIWYGTRLRGDASAVSIGEGSNVQDLSTIASLAAKEVVIGKNVTVGHKAVIVGSSVGSGTLVGMGAQVYNSTVEDGAMVAAGAVLKDAHVPMGQLWAGNPAAFVRELTKEEVKAMTKQAEAYSALSATHRAGFADVKELIDSEGAQDRAM